MRAIGGFLAYLAGRTLRCDLWIARVGLLFLAAYSALDFALPVQTFAAAPRPYKSMARFPENAWAAGFAILAVLTVLTLLSESRATRGPWCQLTWQLHALVWPGIGLSFVLNSPGSWTAWILVGVGVIAEFTLIQPYLLRRFGGAWCG